jgi:hypothetical protein
MKGQLIMKNGKCKLLILSLIAALTLSSLAGCGGKKDDNSSSSESSDSSSAESTVDPESLVKQPVQFYYPTDSSEEMVTENPLDAEDNTKSASESSDSSSSSDNSEESNEETTQYVNVTDANGENVTDSNGENVTEVVKVTSASNNSGNSSSDSNAETATKYVAVTDANGENVVDENGETVTEAVKVTEASNSSNDNNNNNNDNSSTSGNSDDSSSSGGDASTYTSYMQDSWAMWIDISKDEDYIFQGEFIEVTFKIKDSTPDGVYNVDITNPDFANLVNGGTTVTPDTVVGGKVFVNQEAEEQREFTDADGFAVYGDYVSAKQGDEVTFRFYMNNNPGLVAINFHFEYDMNAMDIVSCKTVGEFAAISDTSFSENENNLVQ